MKKLLLTICLVLSLATLDAQSLYFPPTTGTTWDTISPSTLGWCQPRIDTLYSFLQAKNTEAFIVLKDGKIVLEKYFGTFTVDSPHIWNSASKSLTATLTGIAQENGIINIDSPATHYLGVGWTSETPAQEDSITLLNLLTMTSGMNPLPAGCTNIDTNIGCLTYLVPVGTQWTYHTGAYRKLENVMSDASGLNYNVLTQNYIGTTIGMPGVWVQQEFVSTPRSAARFGLLTLNHDIWAGDTLLHDTAYYTAMINTSQLHNLSYGYLWWLNGKASYLTPSSQIVTSGALIPNGPDDMICALGKNDQKIYVIPSTGMVVVRMGNAADSSTDASSAFDNELWAYIDSLDSCSVTPSGINDLSQGPHLSIYPNPVNDVLYIQGASTAASSSATISILNLLGEVVAAYAYSDHIDISSLPDAMYIISVTDHTGHFIGAAKMIKQ
jgi:CubicO group peptidase (beta-lactamase class C family)